MNSIYFYDANKQYGELSNFYNAKITYDGLVYPSSEHLFQSLKCEEYQKREMVRLAPTPDESKSMARRFPIRKDWDNIKDGIMLTCLRLKFKYNTGCRNVLLSTGSKYLVENTTKDVYWGCGSDGNGKNMLGKLLMQVRDEIKQHK
jgi:ribA/ribD-fused uncharacterized protein